jgi:carbonic anhydrase
MALLTHSAVHSQPGRASAAAAAAHCADSGWIPSRVHHAQTTAYNCTRWPVLVQPYDISTAQHTRKGEKRKKRKKGTLTDSTGRPILAEPDDEPDDDVVAALEALPFITMACGGLQFASGVTRRGVVAKLVPVSVIAGFTTGVGTLILTGQLPKAFGMAVPAGMNPLELLGYIAQNIGDSNPSAAALAVGTSAAMFSLPKLHQQIPAALLAVGGATLTTHTLGLDVALIGSIPSGLEAFKFGIPGLPPIDAWPSLSATVLLINSMISVETLLSCAALEKMKRTTYTHTPYQELIGQGLANVGAGLFTGMPVTSVIARSSLNVTLGSTTRLPALVQAGFVFGSVAFMSQSIAMVPMSALSGVLITTGMGMLNPTEFKHCYAVQKSDVVPFVVTIGGMVVFGLAEGVGFGCVSALALNKYVTMEVFGKMSATEASNGHQQGVIQSPIWHINGAINFVSMFEIDRLIKQIKESRVNAAQDSPVVLDVEGITSVEFTGCEELVNRLIEVADDAPIQFVNVKDNLESALDQCDPQQVIQRVR